MLFQVEDFFAFLVEQKIAHFQGHRGPDLLDLALGHLGGDLPEEAQAQGIHPFNAAPALAGGTRRIGADLGGGPQTLAGEFQQAELRQTSPP